MERDVAEKALRKTAFDFLGRVIRRTPVDTGRARAGWTAFLIAKGRTVNIGGRDPQAIAEGEAASFFEEKFRGTNQFILLGNGVNYILPLEFGHSKQAPAGMMRLTMREMASRKRLTKEMRAELVNAIRKADRETRAVRG